MEKYQDITNKLEYEELKMETVNTNVYIKLLACYLIQNKLIEAKFLWLRIPQDIKENKELNQLHMLLQALHTNDLSAFFKCIVYEWSPCIEPIMSELRELIRKNGFMMIGEAYTAIFEENLIDIMNMSREELKASCSELGWKYSCLGQEVIILPHQIAGAEEIEANSENQLAKLTEFVSFLEN